jgi:hypothetical protein
VRDIARRTEFGVDGERARPFDWAVAAQHEFAALPVFELDVYPSELRVRVAVSFEPGVRRVGRGDRGAQLVVKLVEPLSECRLLA